ncbi:MAG: DUF1566 domain-containing protein [Bacteroides sp.]|nr:DUF1566 domain-containing protein [Bacteroides sp.]MCP4125090.1 DUF1566 domain-containing protein [Bacteroidota bacterium]
MNQIINYTLLITVVMLLIQSTSLAQCTGDNVFKGTTDNKWEDESNWCAGCVPAGTITGVIRIESNCEVSSGDMDDYTLSNLILADGITFTNNGGGMWTISNVEGKGTYAKAVQTFNGTIKPGPSSLEVLVDPNGTPDSGDEYTLYVHPTNNSTSIVWANHTTTGATDDWNGVSNTNAVVADQGAGTTYAAGLCESLSANGCNWYLPAKNELNAMYEQLGPGGSGDMPTGFYWSSTEANHEYAWGQAFHIVVQAVGDKIGYNRCRCVRR